MWDKIFTGSGNEDVDIWGQLFCLNSTYYLYVKKVVILMPRGPVNCCILLLTYRLTTNGKCGKDDITILSGCSTHPPPQTYPPATNSKMTASGQLAFWVFPTLCTPQPQEVRSPFVSPDLVPHINKHFQMSWNMMIIPYSHWQYRYENTCNQLGKKEKPEADEIFSLSMYIF